MLKYTPEVFGDNPWIFQQSSAPTHASKKNSGVIWTKFAGIHRQKILVFLFPRPQSFGLLWGVMQAALKNQKFTTLKWFKKFLVKIWKEIPDETLRNACDSFPKCLRATKKANDKDLNCTNKISSQELILFVLTYVN